MNEDNEGRGAVFYAVAAAITTLTCIVITVLYLLVKWALTL